MPELSVSTPCRFCSENWLPSAWRGSRIRFEEVPGEEVHFCDAFGTALREPFYPHPFCLRGHEVTPRLSEGFFSPVKQLEMEGSGPALAVATGEIESRLLAGRGIDLDPERAALKARMEWVERAAALLPPRGRVRWASAFELRGEGTLGVPVMDPAARAWIEGRKFSDDETVWVPVEFCQLESRAIVSSPLVRADSTGMCVHDSRDEAIKGGLFEVLERAGIERALAGKPTALLSLSGLRELGGEIAESFLSRGLTLSAFFEEPVRGFYACGVITEAPLAAGAAGDIDPVAALRSALLELYGQRKNGEEGEPLGKNFSVARWLDGVPVRETPPARTMTDWRRIASDLEAVIVDRGNALTEALELSAVQVLVPSMMLRRWAPGGAEVTPFG